VFYLTAFSLHVLRGVVDVLTDSAELLVNCGLTSAVAQASWWWRRFHGGGYSSGGGIVGCLGKTATATTHR